MAKTILVVGPESRLRRALVGQLHRMKHETIEVANGEEAIEKSLIYPDMVLMSLDLPGMNGLETTIRIKQNPNTAYIPVIGYTYGKAEPHRDVALKAGMSEFISLPVASRILRQVIEKILATY